MKPVYLLLIILIFLAGWLCHKFYYIDNLKQSCIGTADQALEYYKENLEGIDNNTMAKDITGYTHKMNQYLNKSREFYLCEMYKRYGVNTSGI